MCQPESNNLLGYASCWIQRVACLFYPPTCKETAKQACNLLNPTTCSTLCVASCWIQQLAYPSKLLDSTLMYLYDADVLIRIPSVFLRHNSTLWHFFPPKVCFFYIECNVKKLHDETCTSKPARRNLHAEICMTWNFVARISSGGHINLST